MAMVRSEKVGRVRAGRVETLRKAGAHPSDCTGGKY